MTLEERLHFKVGRWYVGKIYVDGIFQGKKHFLVVDRSVHEISIIEENNDDFIDIKKVKKYHISINKHYKGEEHFYIENFYGNSLNCIIEKEVDEDTEDISSVEFRY